MIVVRNHYTARIASGLRDDSRGGPYCTGTPRRFAKRPALHRDLATIREAARTVHRDFAMYAGWPARHRDFATYARWPVMLTGTSRCTRGGPRRVSGARDVRGLFPSLHRHFAMCARSPAGLSGCTVSVFGLRAACAMVPRPAAGFATGAWEPRRCRVAFGWYLWRCRCFARGLGLVNRFLVSCVTLCCAAGLPD